MKINFFEEFPTKDNLRKIKQIQFPSLLFIATKNLDEFSNYKHYIRKLNKNIKVGYWPVLEKEEGYWLSPFSDSIALKKQINGLNDKKERITVLWDCEFPINKKLISPNLKFFSNKKLITDFLQNTHHEIYTAEHPSFWFLSNFFQFCGISFPFIKKRIIMAYTSLGNFLLKQWKRDQIKTNKYVALGVITRGVQGNEPILKPEELDVDLNIARQNNVEEVFIFRLGGLNKKYMRVIEKYTS